LAIAGPARFWAVDLLHVWFHKLGPRVWFSPDPRADAMLAARFGPVLQALGTQPPGAFLTDPATALASVLLFDQVPRNIHRGQPQAFAHDPVARAITREALRRRWDRRLTPVQRQFLAMPLMHSEQISDQRLSLQVFRALGAGYGWPFARSHYRMIARFGRFPHRNRVLGRVSSAAERRAIAEGNAW
jgi:uncharacterized protein (DUF924 family)